METFIPSRISSLDQTVFPLCLRGSDFEIGLQRGQRLGEDLRRMWQWMGARMSSMYGLPESKWSWAAQKSADNFQEEQPWMLEQISGMSEGSGLGLDEILLMNMYGLIWSNSGNWCSSVALRVPGGGCWVGQNLDLGNEDFYYMEEMHSSAAYSILSGAMMGMCSAPCGINDQGLVVASSNLPAPAQSGQRWSWNGIPYYHLPFSVLRLCRSVKEAVLYLQSLPSTIPGSAGYQLNIMDIQGDMAVVDKSGNRTIVRQCEENLNFTTNCTLDHEMESWRLGEGKANVDGLERANRIRQEYQLLNGQFPSREWLMQLMASDQGDGCLCRTNERGFSRQGFIFDPVNLTMDICNGPPNRNLYERFSLERK